MTTLWASRGLFWGASLLLTLFALSTTLVRVSAISIPIVVSYNVQGDVVYPDNTVSTTFDSAMTKCMANGLNLLSAESQERRMRLWTLVSNKVDSDPRYYSTYTSISAKKAALNKRCTYVQIEESVQTTAGKPDPAFCIFTIQWGLFSRQIMMNPYGDQPGLNMYEGVYQYYAKKTEPRLECGKVAPWGTGFKWDNGAANPFGKNYTVLTTGSVMDDPVFANIEPVAPNDFYLSPNKFVTACEAQLDLATRPYTFNATQPVFIKGYKDLTWVQNHWWVLFIIIGGVVLIVLFAILIFCCVTSAPPKEGPPIAPMVLRERNGQAYVNASDDDSTPVSRGVRGAAVCPFGRMVEPQGCDEVMSVAPVPLVDPEDLIQATPSVYSQDDVMQTTEGDSIASSEENESLSEEEERSWTH